MSLIPGTNHPATPSAPPEHPPQGREPIWAVLFVFIFFGVLAIWGVAAASITAVAIAVVTVLPTLPRALGHRRDD